MSPNPTESTESELLGRFGDPFLLGDCSIADAFYAPVASRFRTYGIKPGGAAGAYVDAILGTPDFMEWEAAAKTEA